MSNTATKCRYRSNNVSCGAWAMKDSAFCFSHNPEVADKRRAAVIAGGSVTYEHGLIPLEPIDFTDATPILWLLADTINRTRKVRADGTMDVKTANCIGQLARVMLESQKEITMEKRLEKLELVSQQSNL